ncbi:alpha-galactosidase [Actinospica sp. MGRD01-02]|uniref:Alpha-galactosidase n=1 Tax=Actinospica acidithermotolerans TaxID=2828514 RepID=A0A941IH82_9ACTN|nr:glycoside hydrolase family 36 protein [Actinospica acidithermotolerans]MBR7828255.1 alpha-galactosidase [Actinospica acidithermotolerans]
MIITFGHALELDLYCAEGEPPRLAALRAGGSPLAAESTDPATLDILPLSHIELAGHSREHINGKRHIGGAVSSRLQYVRHDITRAGQALLLEITSRDPITDLTVVARIEQHPDIAAIRSSTRVTAGSHEVVLLHVASLVIPGVLAIADTALGAAGRWEDRLTAWTAANPWCGEGRWTSATLSQRGLTATEKPDARNRFALASTGSWSSSEHLPMGALTDEHTGRALAWQIEHNGSWAWEIGDTHDAVYVSLSGPSDAESQWSKVLAPGESFTTVPATLAASAHGLEGAIGELTKHRRVTRRPHADLERLPIIFNDYMNCLGGDPSTDRLLPLIDAAARAGAEYFVVDAGWYDDTDGWWDSVGEWQPSTVRFPGGLDKVMELVRERGMTPGLWLEPEVVGVRSPMAGSLPDGAFFQRAGRRLTERGRHQLDFRHPASRAHLDATVDRLVSEYGIGYFKLDYNIEVGPGTDHAADSAGDGLLGHNRAYRAWIDGVLDRHPGLVIESCSSGGMRTDYAMLAATQLHSVTDQTDFHRLPAIAAAAPMAVTPEQSAMWAYPVPAMTDRETAFNLAGALLGRIHLSGRLDLLRPEQEALVHQALAAYRELRPHLPAALPHWPVGLPAWRDGWVALALETDGPDRDSPVAGYVLAWRRDADDLAWHQEVRSLTVRLPEWSAVLVRLTRV